MTGTVTVIKVVLVAGLVLALVLALRGPAQRQLAVRRLLGLATVGAGVVAVVWPDLTTRLAALVGVGRGTDLVLYLAVVGFLFLSVAFAQRLARLEDQVTRLTRELALRDAPDHERML